MEIQLLWKHVHNINILMQLKYKHKVLSLHHYYELCSNYLFTDHIVHSTGIEKYLERWNLQKRSKSRISHSQQTSIAGPVVFQFGL